MPRKRRLADDEDSESDIEPQRRSTTTALIPRAMHNIQNLKAKRDKVRRDIAKEFDTYLTKKKKDVEHHYAAEAEHRTAQIADLLNKYTAALDQRVAIEKSINGLVDEAREDLKELTMFIGAAYSGRQESAAKAVSSLTFTTSIPAKDSAHAATTGSGKVTDAGAQLRQNETRQSNGRVEDRSFTLDIPLGRDHGSEEVGRDSKGERGADDATYGRESKHDSKKGGGDNIFNQISW
ncbi:hypothetical protein F5Y19DRAFT_10547 [Xylariaceae sp. FL1651]|nr:hypothetical protein F5Y19DRAFT_10547 [Xylariaceae sp. FL1651]